MASESSPIYRRARGIPLALSARYRVNGNAARLEFLTLIKVFGNNEKIVLSRSGNAKKALFR